MTKTKQIEKWIKEYFDNTARPNIKAVIGISGGKDSTIVAQLCVNALGADRVLGVFLPYGNQANLELSREITEYLGIEAMTVDIEPMERAIKGELMANKEQPSNQAEVNVLPRLRMTALYYISQTIGGRVSNNCNLSESVMGFSTQWGDNVGDFAPIRNLTVSEVIELGHELGLPAEWVDRIPQDDLNIEVIDGVEKVLSDEDVLGISYEDIDNVIHGRSTGDDAQDKINYDKVRKAYKNSLFKRRQIASYINDDEFRKSWL